MASNQTCPSLLETSIIAAISKQPLRFWDGRRSCWDAVAQRKEKLKKQIRRHIKESQMISTVLSTSNSLAYGSRYLHFAPSPQPEKIGTACHYRRQNVTSARCWKSQSTTPGSNAKVKESKKLFNVPRDAKRRHSMRTPQTGIWHNEAQIYIDHRDVVQTTSSLASKYL